jgi:hypothetical protein
VTLPAISAEPAGKAEAEPPGLPLVRDDLQDLFTDKTVKCRKEKDQSNCLNYFSPKGEFIQVMSKDSKRKDGRWFLDDTDRLCILWNGRLKPLCFSVFEQDDGTYYFIKRGKHVSTALELADGNTQNY